MTSSAVIVVLLVAVLAAALGYLVGSLRAGAERFDAGVAASERAVAPVARGLDRLGEQLHRLEVDRARTDAHLVELRRETSTLSTALRKPQVRGRWGELHLRRAVELAGMVEHCDFDEQVVTPDGRRPDLVVRLAGGRRLVVDAKVPLDAFLDASGAVDPVAAEPHLLRHAGQVRSHVDQLSGKAYWTQFDDTPEFVVMFLPGESFLAAALATEPDLLEYAAAKRVVLATPTTLIALLRTAAHAWTQDALAANAREIITAARELHDRLGTVAGHLDRLGSGLERAVRSYNEAIGSVESRLLVTSRRLSTLDVADTPVETPRIIDTTPRAMTAVELTDELTSAS